MERIGNPWLGLASYEEKDEYRFKGRNKDVECVLTKLQQNDSLVCYAESGAGKSSLINAGLSPAMRRNRMFPIRIKFTTEEYEGKNIPLKKEDETIDFDQLILKKINQSLEIYKQNVLEIYDFGEDFAINFEQIEQYKTKEQYKTNINNGISSLWWKLRTETIRITFGEYDYIPVLIFDQFEEIFSATWTKEFFQWLEILMKDVCPDSVSIDKEYYKEGHRIPNKKLFKLLLSLRSEYIGELDYWCGQITFIPQIQKNRYFLKSFTKEQAIEVISAQDQDDEISKKLKEEANIIVDCILDASGMEKGVSDINEVPSVALSLVCHSIYNEWGENESFSLNKYNLDDLIYDFYRNQLNSIGISDNYRHVLETVLISSQKKRLRIPISDSRLFGIQQALNNLISQHIIKCENINGEKYIELVHDCLVQAIYKKSREERKDNVTKEKINKNIATFFKKINIILFIIVSITSYLVLYPNVDFAKSENASILATGFELNNKNLIIDSVNKKISLPKDNAFRNATSLSINGGGYKSYENVVYTNPWYNYYQTHNPSIFEDIPDLDKEIKMCNYAQNAKSIVIGEIDSICHFNFGQNVHQVIFLSPEMVKSIQCQNNRTQIYVPYKYFDYCRELAAFDGVSYKELGVFETIKERLCYNNFIYNGEFRFVINMIVPIVIIFIIFICLLRQSRIVKFKLFVNMILYLILTILLFLNLDYCYQIGDIIFVLLMSVFLARCFTIYDIYKMSNKWKYSIVYNNNSDKQNAINVKKKIIKCRILRTRN